MSNLKYFYNKYKIEFEALEMRCNKLFYGNPFQYEQALFLYCDDYFDRDGRILKPVVLFGEDGEYAGMKNEYIIAPPQKKEKIDAYWEQRDRVDILLRENEEYQKFLRTRRSHDGEAGLSGFFWLSHFAIKYKIYPL